MARGERIAQKYDAKTVTAYRERLSLAQFAILIAAAKNPTYETMAAELAIPVGTVRSRLSRARMALAKLCADGRQQETTGEQICG